MDVDVEHEGFGWGRVARLRLEDGQGQQHEIADALVLALHAADEDDLADEGDPDIELRVGDEVLVVRLSTFLEAWAPRMPRVATWVLALCNPGQRSLRRPAAIPREAALWYGLGDVDSWADEDRAGPVYGLSANEWVCA